jgi:two-component system, response regulator
MILVVEDSPDDEALMMRALGQGRAGPVTVARDGAEALEYLLPVDEVERPVPDVVLLDLHLPRVKGFEVLRRIRAEARTRHVPVVILTSSFEQEDVARGYELGANSFVGKPVDPESFVDAIQKIARYWLELNRAARERGEVGH